MSALDLDTDRLDRERLERIEARLDALLAHAEQRDADLEPLRDLAAEVGVLAVPATAAITGRVAAWDIAGLQKPVGCV